jgi:glucose/arabinose dehydrogenase
VSQAKTAKARGLVAFLAMILVQPASAAPSSVGGDPVVDPHDFEITEFASGLDFPLSMQELEDGSLLVGVARTDGSGGNFFSSIGELLRLVDSDEDGEADGPGTLLYTGLPGAVTSVRVVDDLAIVASGVIGSWSLVLLRRGASPSDTYTLLGSVDFSFPLPWSHLTFGTSARPAPGQPGHVDVFFNLGSRESAVVSTDLVPYSGLISGSLAVDAIYHLAIDDTGPAPVLSAPVQLATGVRNGFGSAIHAGSGDLYFADNGFEDPLDPVVPLMTDELNRIAAANIGGAVEDFGFPDNYIEYRTGNEIGSGGIDPEVAFQPIPIPAGVASQGPTEISFAPPAFPMGLRSGVFVGFHGSFSDVGLANTSNPVVYVDLSTGNYFHFVSNNETDVGHPDGLLATEDSLFVADFTTVSGLDGFGTGAIYQIRALPPEVPAMGPRAIGVLAVLILGVGVLARRWAKPVKRAWKTVAFISIYR